MSEVKQIDTEDLKLTLHMDFDKPVSLIDLTAAFTSLEDQYGLYASRHDTAKQSDGAKLYVKSLKSGSIFAEFITYADQINLVLDHKELLVGFVTHWAEICDFLLGRRPSLPEYVSTKDIEQVSNFYEYAAKDNAAQVNLSASSGNNVYNNCTFNHIEANAIQNGAARHLSKKPLPEDREFVNELLYMHQARDDASSAIGDYGFIDAISPKRLKLTWADAEAKRRVMGEDVFHTIYVVSGRVQTVEGTAKAIHIREVHDTMPK